jgi:multiple sugar transport system permease protein
MVAKSDTTPAQPAEITSTRYVGKKKSFSWWLGRSLLYLFVFTIAITSLTPFLWMVDPAFNPGRFSMIYPPVVFPPGMGFMNFQEVLTQTAQKTNFLLYFRNTIWYSLWVVIGQLISCSLAAYAFARLKFPGRDQIFYLYLATMMLPVWVVIIPQFVEMKTFGWYNTMWCMTVPGMFGSAFGTFLLRQFFITIPTELDDAALIDGANKFQIYYLIILPLAKSALTVLAVFTLLAVWNAAAVPGRILHPLGIDHGCRDDGRPANPGHLCPGPAVLRRRHYPDRPGRSLKGRSDEPRGFHSIE